jgi:hypothetical protein
MNRANECGGLALEMDHSLSAAMTPAHVGDGPFRVVRSVDLRGSDGLSLPGTTFPRMWMCGAGHREAVWLARRADSFMEKVTGEDHAPAEDVVSII